MTREDFGPRLEMMIEKEPFTIFTVELNDGTRFEIDDPRAITWRDGTAVFLGPRCRFHWFRCDEVKRIFVPSAL